MRKLLLLAIAILGISTAQAQKITARDFAKAAQGQVGLDVGMGFVMKNIYADGQTVVYVAEVPQNFAAPLRLGKNNPQVVKNAKQGVINTFSQLQLGPLFTEAKINIRYVYQYRGEHLMTVTIHWYDF